MATSLVSGRQESCHIIVARLVVVSLDTLSKTVLWASLKPPKRLCGVQEKEARFMSQFPALPDLANLLFLREGDPVLRKFLDTLESSCVFEKVEQFAYIECRQDGI